MPAPHELTPRSGREPEERALAALLWLYIALCFVIAGLNFALAPRADEATRRIISLVWGLYENEFKVLLMIVAAVLVLRLEGRRRPAARGPSMRRTNIIGFCISAFALHIGASWAAGTHELYFFSMPFPWSSVPLQVLDPASTFVARNHLDLGPGGLALVIVVWGAINAVVFAGTLLWGRRWQCSTLCMFNGFAAELFAPVMPLVGRGKQPGARGRRAFAWARWGAFGLSLGLSLYWALRLAGVDLFPLAAAPALTAVETWKYLAAELLLAMFLWVAFGGRGYCRYCSLGTTLALVAKAADQRIEAAPGTCVACGGCDRACPMGIAIMARAREGRPTRSVDCVGCGRCVDACPRGTLHYATRFTRAIRRGAGAAGGKGR